MSKLTVRQAARRLEMKRTKVTYHGNDVVTLVKKGPNYEMTVLKTFLVDPEDICNEVKR